MKLLKEEYIHAYIQNMLMEEKSLSTIQKYSSDIRKFYDFIGTEDVTKEKVVQFKEHLKDIYKISSVNSMLVALNRFFVFLKWNDLKVKEFKIQKQVFSIADKELSKDEYERLLKTAKTKKNERLVMLMQAICTTGIRVSEHKFITVETLKQGYMTITNKGKVREVFFPKDLQKLLMKYCENNNITEGCVFRTRSGKPIDRSNIWKMMKSLSEKAEVDKNKVYPHSLRHLFAVTYYTLEKDIVHLAAILGHSNVETTRIYIRYNSQECLNVFNKMNLLHLNL